MLLINIFFISLSRKNCGCYGNLNSQNVAPVGDMCCRQHLCLFRLDLVYFLHTFSMGLVTRNTVFGGLRTT